MTSVHNAEAPHASEHGGNLVGQAAGEEILRRIAGIVLQWQHRKRRAVLRAGWRVPNPKHQGRYNHSAQPALHRAHQKSCHLLILPRCAEDSRNSRTSAPYGCTRQELRAARLIVLQVQGRKKTHLPRRRMTMPKKTAIEKA